MSALTIDVVNPSTSSINYTANSENEHEQTFERVVSTNENFTNESTSTEIPTTSSKVTTVSTSSKLNLFNQQIKFQDKKNKQTVDFEKDHDKDRDKEDLNQSKEEAERKAEEDFLAFNKIPTRNSLRIQQSGLKSYKFYSCIDCGAKFSDNTSLRSHEKNVHGNRHFQCETCCIGFRNEKILEMHKHEHSASSESQSEKMQNLKNKQFLEPDKNLNSESQLLPPIKNLISKSNSSSSVVTNQSPRADSTTDELSRDPVTPSIEQIQQCPSSESNQADQTKEVSTNISSINANDSINNENSKASDNLTVNQTDSLLQGITNNSTTNQITNETDLINNSNLNEVASSSKRRLSENTSSNKDNDSNNVTTLDMSHKKIKLSVENKFNSPLRVVSHYSCNKCNTLFTSEDGLKDHVELHKDPVLSKPVTNFSVVTDNVTTENTETFVRHLAIVEQQSASTSTNAQETQSISAQTVYKKKEQWKCVLCKQFFSSLLNFSTHLLEHLHYRVTKLNCKDCTTIYESEFQRFEEVKNHLEKGVHKKSSASGTLSPNSVSPISNSSIQVTVTSSVSPKPSSSNVPIIRSANIPQTPQKKLPPVSTVKPTCKLAPTTEPLSISSSVETVSSSNSPDVILINSDEEPDASTDDVIIEDEIPNQTQTLRTISHYSCSVCKFRHRCKNEIENHMKTHKDNSEARYNSMYKCHLCSRAFSKRCSLNLHQLEHDNRAPYLCEFCKRPFSNSIALTKHHSAHMRYRMGHANSTTPRPNSNSSSSNISTVDSFNSNSNTSSPVIVNASVGKPEKKKLIASAPQVPNVQINASVSSRVSPQVVSRTNLVTSSVPFQNNSDVSIQEVHPQGQRNESQKLALAQGSPTIGRSQVSSQTQQQLHLIQQRVNQPRTSVQQPVRLNQISNTHVRLPPQVSAHTSPLQSQLNNPLIQQQSNIHNRQPSSAPSVMIHQSNAPLTVSQQTYRPVAPQITQQNHPVQTHIAYSRHTQQFPPGAVIPQSTQPQANIQTSHPSNLSRIVPIPNTQIRLHTHSPRPNVQQQMQPGGRNIAPSNIVMRPAQQMAPQQVNSAIQQQQAISALRTQQSSFRFVRPVGQAPQATQAQIQHLNSSNFQRSPQMLPTQQMQQRQRAFLAQQHQQQAIGNVNNQSMQYLHIRQQVPQQQFLPQQITPQQMNQQQMQQFMQHRQMNPHQMQQQQIQQQQIQQQQMQQRQQHPHLGHSMIQLQQQVFISPHSDQNSSMQAQARQIANNVQLPVSFHQQNVRPPIQQSPQEQVSSAHNSVNPELKAFTFKQEIE